MSGNSQFLLLFGSGKVTWAQTELRSGCPPKLLLVTAAVRWSRELGCDLQVVLPQEEVQGMSLLPSTSP